MNIIQKLAKNAGLLFISQIITYILAFFYVIYIARYLGAEGFGVLSFALAFTGIFAVFIDLGLSTLTVREVAKDKSLTKKYINNTLLIKIILSILTFLFIVLTLNLLKYPGSTLNIVYIISLSVIFGSFSQTVYSIFQAYEKMEYQSLGNTLNSILMLIGVILLIQQNVGVLEFALLYVMVSFVIMIYNFIVCIWKFVIPKLDLDLKFWKKLILNAIPLGLISIFIILFVKVDTIMLSKMAGDIAVGWYNAAVNLVQSLSFITGALMAAIFPVFSKFNESSKDSFNKLYEKSFQYLLIIILPIGIGTSLLADKFILLIYGVAYVNSIIALQILIWWYVLGSMSWLIGTVLNSTNRQKVFVMSSAFCLIFNIIANLFLIPILSYVGASIVTIATEAILFILLFHYFPKDIYKPQLKSIALKPLIAGLIMAVFVYYFKDFNLFFNLALATIIYFITLSFIGGINKEDLVLFRNIINKYD
jgi:O-antigen/teichoic acid export membrane protein